MKLPRPSRRCCLLLALLLVAAGAEPPFTNRLARQSSPYLLQHAHNPVDWFPWGEEAFAKAKKEGKLIFLSSGYSSCHWCHVMERESFMNDEIAGLMNQHFVCIKLDREERPEVDHLYLTALNVMGRNGGWPLSMFLTADGKPIAGGTYWPPDDREVQGQTVPGFKSVLKAVISAQQGAPENLSRTAELRAQQTRLHLAQSIRSGEDIELSRDLVDRAVQELRGTFDPDHGGFGTPPFRGPKFPRPPLLRLLQAASVRDAPDASRLLNSTLEKIARGGIYDQLGGGFHRYSTERTWTVPHFEKMLYDNGQLLEVYADAYAATQSELYRNVLRQTIDFVAREMTSPEGMFYTALDADTQGEEGRYYVWTDEELEAAIPNEEERRYFRISYALEDGPNFEGRFHILLKPSRPMDPDRLQQLNSQLLAVRQQRPRPALDTKVLTAWNGLMIAGLASAGKTLDDATVIESARRAADALLKAMQTSDGGLLHSYAAVPGESAKARGPGYLDDYTHLVHGLLVLHDVTGEPRWLDTARSLTHTMLARFQDPDAGGFYFTSQEHEQLFARMKDQYDGVQPSGNSQAAANLVRLWKKTGDQEYRDLAERTIQTFAATLRDEPRSMCTMTAALAQLLDVQP